MIYGFFSQTFLLAADTNNAVWTKNVWWWSLPLIIVGLLALILVIVQFAKMLRGARACRFPLAETSEVEINQIGKLFLRFEVPKSSSMTGSNLNYELFNRQRGDAPVELKPVVNPLTMKTGQMRTFPVRVFEIAETGKYLLKVSGFDSREDYTNCSLIISPSIHLKSFLFVLGIVLSGLMFAGGLVFTIIAATANN